MNNVKDNKSMPLIIAICFAGWPLVIPLVVGILLLIKYQKENEAQTNEINISRQILSSPEYIAYSNNKEAERQAAERLAYTNGIIQNNNNLINSLQQEIAKLNESLSQLEKKTGTEKKKLAKMSELRRSIDYAVSNYLSYEPAAVRFQLPNSNNSDLEEYAPSVTLHLHSMDVRDLQKAFRKNNKEIESVMEQYVSRYTTKGNKTIYQLMVIALRAELQNILVALKYDKLDSAIDNVKKVTSKYLSIAADGNQNIAGTLTKFVGQIEYLFINAVKIEYNYYVKQEQIKQEQQAIREQMRIEAQERKALEDEKKKIEKEEQKYNDAIENLRKQLLEAKEDELEQLKLHIKELESQRADIIIKKDEITKLQNGKAGNVYIISNLGSFGEDVFKVGMTRRSKPEERVNELGDASVPFKFDVHSFIFSDNAVDLETKMHQRLNEYRVNKVNLRKEFFRIPLDDLENLVYELDPTAVFNRTMAAEEYRQSLSTTENYTSDYSFEEDDDE